MYVFTLTDWLNLVRYIFQINYNLIPFCLDSIKSIFFAYLLLLMLVRLLEGFGGLNDLLKIIVAYVKFVVVGLYVLYQVLVDMIEVI